MVVADADQLGAIVVTRNRRHFSPLITRDNSKAARRFPNASLISFRCRLDTWIPMLDQYLPLIQLEYSRRMDTDDPRLIVEIDHGRIGFR